MGTTTSMTVSSRAVAPASMLRQPSGEISLAGIEVSDWCQRHPGATIPIENVASDWFERHPDLLNAANAVDRSDYFLQRPTANTAALSDYFLRHPTERNLETAAGATDDFHRHPDSRKASHAFDLSDWFQRHPESVSR